MSANDNVLQRISDASSNNVAGRASRESSDVEDGVLIDLTAGIRRPNDPDAYGSGLVADGTNVSDAISDEASSGQMKRRLSDSDVVARLAGLSSKNGVAEIDLLVDDPDLRA